ncbi:MAG: TRAP transporter small permease [Desulfatiglandales bacterium]
MTDDKDASREYLGQPAWKSWGLVRAINGKIRIVEDWLNICSVFLIMILMFFASGEIIGRYVFNFPIPGHVELVELLMAGIVFLGIAYTEREGGHIRMELFLTRVLKGRAYHTAEIITSTLSLFVYIFIMYYSFRSTLNAIQVGDSTAYLYWPTWPSKMLIPIGSLLLCIRFIIEIFQHLCQVVAGAEMRELD